MSELDTRPTWQTALLVKAFELLRIEELDDLKSWETRDLNACTTEEIAAAAYALLYDDLRAAYERTIEARESYDPNKAKCGWCITAAGGSIGAWDAAPTYDDVRSHTKVCEHNPLVTRIQELLAVVVKLSQETPLDEEVKNAIEAQRKLIAEVGTLRSRVRELEALLDQRDATIKDIYSTSNA